MKKYVQYATVVLATALLGVFQSAQAQPQAVGQWMTRPEPMTINPVHLGLLRTGKVLVIAGTGNDSTETVSRAAVWDPGTGAIAVQVIPWDLLCNGMSFLPDGQAFITGGSAIYNPTYKFRGLKNTTLFDPATLTFRRVEDMAHGRWYPTNVTLPDGRVATFSGYDESGTINENGKPNRTYEIYTLGSGWSPERPMGWPTAPPNYPRAHLTSAGELFFSGSQRPSHILNLGTLTWRYNVASTVHTAPRTYGSSVLLGLRSPDYPVRILIAGGDTSGSATNTAEILDLSRTPSRWNPTGAMDFARVQHNAVLLPNGRVLAVGGSAVNNIADTNGGGRFSEMYNPDTGDWTRMAQQVYWRFYHSVALLLPDGRVVSMGSNVKGTFEKRIEIFSPPYLFTTTGALAPRPSLTGAPPQIGYAAAFDVTTPAPAAIAEAVLMRPGASTHAFDMEQSLVELDIQAVFAGGLRLIGPPNGNVAPPGYYMLFLIDSAGVPSVATFVRLTQPTAPVPPSPTPVVKCLGKTATIVGTSGHDLLIGTSGRDVIHGLGDNDIIHGLGGNDLICGGRGDDFCNGGKGKKDKSRGCETRRNIP